ncbi:hypothetical protein CYY_003788 [Polysphondylium violaceum]|uniref:J domain-containing protein n=1 Tax=Polysphondylium violaceum TaxID=133409 RepID=A0A8J4UTV3_9MYCE|nr:hypothetical protein CYY_003788 [Polysphondylium violaceum]
MKLPILTILLLTLSITFVSCLTPKEHIEKFIKEGDELFKGGKYDSALKKYSDAIDTIGTDYEHFPEIVSLFFKRAGIYHSRGKLLLALSDVNRAIEINPENVHAKIKRAKIQTSLGRFENAMDEYKHILKSKPDQRQAKDALAQLKTDITTLEKVREMVNVKHNYKEALPLLDKLLKNIQDLKEARLLRTECYYLLGDHRRALEETTAILKSEPKCVPAFYWRGRSFFSVGEKDAALKYLNEGLAFDPENELCLKQVQDINKFEKASNNAKELFNQNRFDQAIIQIKQALEVEPNSQIHSLPLYVLECKANLKQKKPKEAITSCNKAIELDEGSADAYFSRGEVYMYEEDYDKALRDYNKANELRPHDQAITEGIHRAQRGQSMAKRKDLYKILGIPKTATDREVKKAFKVLALQNHPDKSAPEDREAAEKKYMEISHAYEILSDQEKRERYDRGEDVDGSGGNPQQQRGQHGFPFNPFGGGGFGGFGQQQQQHGGQQHFTFNFGGFGR